MNGACKLVGMGARNQAYVLWKEEQDASNH